jgi:ABC-2 type transport system ATP-binding protein
MDSVISTDHLSRNYGKAEAARDLTFEVPKGSIFALLGPNGAGKTTTIHTLMNLREPSSGSATILGVDSKHLGPAPPHPTEGNAAVYMTVTESGF